MKATLKKILTHDGVIALGLLGLFYATHGYLFNWDDHHLEIPLLKRLIDPTLFPGDYYVNSLQKNFITCFYPLLSKLITIPQIEPVYAILFFISRYVMFFFMYKLWRAITGGRLSAALCVLPSMILVRDEEFLYLTFSHQEFALALIFAAVYLFYRERYMWAALVLGLTANIHGVYSLLVMSYMTVFFLTGLRRLDWKKFAAAGGLYLISALPFFCWAVSKSLANKIPADSPLLENWVPLVKLATPEAFIFREIPLEAVTSHIIVFLTSIARIIVFILLYILNIIHNPLFRRDRRAQVIMGLTLVYLAVQYIAGYVLPNQFLLTLNLFRSIQFAHFFLLGYTAWLIFERCRVFPAWAGFLLVMFFTNLASMDLISAAGIIILIMLIGLMDARPSRANIRPTVLWGAGLALAAGLLIATFVLFKINPLVNAKFQIRTTALIVLTVLIYLTRPPWPTRLKSCFLIIPLTLFAFWYTEFHYHQLADPKQGFALIQQHWEDIQRVTREKTPQDAMLLVPYDMEMGGFRTLSERNIICSDRDKNIVAFDFASAREWQQRRAEILSFQVLGKEDYRDALVYALSKYKADYIVFMTHKAPQPNNTLQLMYTNGSFALFKINR